MKFNKLSRIIPVTLALTLSVSVSVGANQESPLNSLSSVKSEKVRIIRSDWNKETCKKREPVTVTETAAATAIGAGVAGATGAGVGAMLGGKTGAVIGGAAGALIGGGIGAAATSAGECVEGSERTIYTVVVQTDDGSIHVVKQYPFPAASVASCTGGNNNSLLVTMSDGSKLVATP